MNDELQRIEMIVSELLVLAKPQATRFSDRDIAEKLQDVATLLNTQAVLNNVEIVLEVDPQLPPVRCEQNQIKQVVQVIDTGMGIPPELIRRLGEPFYTTKENGTGLGLMLSHKIIEAHHGTLAITSQPGQGTTVTVTLPGLPPESADPDFRPDDPHLQSPDQTSPVRRP